MMDYYEYVDKILYKGKGAELKKYVIWTRIPVKDVLMKESFEDICEILKKVKTLCGESRCMQKK